MRRHVFIARCDSQLAPEYVNRFGNDYDLIWWIPAGTRAFLPGVSMQTNCVHFGHPRYRLVLHPLGLADPTEAVQSAR